MSSKLRDSILSVVFLICFILSHILEKYRIPVFICGMTVFAILLFIIYTHITCYMGTNKINKPLVFVCLTLLMFGSAGYTFEENGGIGTQASNNYISIIVFIMVCLICICNVYANRKNQTSFKDKILDFVICMVVSLCLLAGSTSFANYTFDLSDSYQTECYIIKQTDDGLGIPGYFGYTFSEYSVENNGESGISTLEICDKYALKPGDVVKITYRKGLFYGLYSTEYDVNMWIPEEFLSKD